MQAPERDEGVLRGVVPAPRIRRENVDGRVCVPDDEDGSPVREILQCHVARLGDGENGVRVRTGRGRRSRCFAGVDGCRGGISKERLHRTETKGAAGGQAVPTDRQDVRGRRDGAQQDCFARDAPRTDEPRSNAPVDTNEQALNFVPAVAALAYVGVGQDGDAVRREVRLGQGSRDLVVAEGARELVARVDDEEGPHLHEGDVARREHHKAGLRVRRELHFVALGGRPRSQRHAIREAAPLRRTGAARDREDGGEEHHDPLAHRARYHPAVSIEKRRLRTWTRRAVGGRIESSGELAELRDA